MPLNSVEKAAEALNIHTILAHTLPAANIHVRQQAPFSVETHQLETLPHTPFPDLSGVETHGTEVGEVGGDSADQCRFTNAG